MSEAFEVLAFGAPRFEDERGWLQVLHESENSVLKRSFSRQGVFRGLHYQPAPHQQTKLIRVIEGRIRDFVVDMNAPTALLRDIELAPANGWIRIAPNLAHGFYAIEDTLFEYVCDGGYAAGAEQSYSIVAELASLGIAHPTLSRKDRAAPPLGAAFP